MKKIFSFLIALTFFFSPIGVEFLQPSQQSSGVSQIQVSLKIAYALLKTNLQGYWKLDESSGTRVDAHTNGNDLSDINTVPAATGIINNGADFTLANSEYLSITDANQIGLDFSGDFTLSMWVKGASYGINSLLGKWDESANNQRAYRPVYFDATGIMSFYYSSDGIESLTKDWTSITLNIDTWYHLVFVNDVSGSNDINFYINGVSQTAVATAVSPFNASSAFVIGADINGVTPQNFFDGIIDEVAVWSRAITSAEVTEIYNSGNALAFADWDAVPATGFEWGTIIQTPYKPFLSLLNNLKYI